ncbi:MAG: ATP-binding cassette domain-containing protein [Pseudomonadota bacterium]|nr:ATP-binding cassette domain-containing protein [Pseudomonadota bacterium]
MGADRTLRVAVTLAIGASPLTLDLASDAATIGLVGPSGVGKSTLLRVVAGLERRAVGTVGFAGEVWQDSSPRRTPTFLPPHLRRVGWVPQDGVLFPHLSVRENLAYAARAPVEPVAELLGVAHLYDRRPRHLSGGERQRVALGRALCAAPRLLLLDEPFSALDRPLRARLAADVAGWARTHALSILLVTHDERDLSAFEAEVWEIEGERGDLATRSVRRAPARGA